MKKHVSTGSVSYFDKVLQWPIVDWSVRKAYSHLISVSTFALAQDDGPLYSIFDIDCLPHIPQHHRERLLTLRGVVLALVRRLGVSGALGRPLCGAGASRAHARNGGFRRRPDPHACYASGPHVCGH